MTTTLRTTLTLLLALLPACLSAERQEKSIESLDGASLSHNQLRTRVLAFTAFFAREVSESADRIAAQADDPEQRRNTRLWKIYSVSAAQTSGMRVNPVMAVLDTWSLVVRMRMMLERDGGEQYFGKHQASAIAVARELEGAVEALAASTAPPEPFEKARVGLHAHALEHPIEDLYFARWGAPSSVFLSFVGSAGGSALSSVATLEDRVTHLTMILPEIVEISSDLARWQMELVMQDLLATDALHTALADLDQIGELALSVRGLVEETRLAAIEDLVAAVDAQREAVTEAMNDQRQQLQVVLAAERIAALTGVNEQRAETLALLQEERQIVLDAVDRTVADAVATVPAQIQDGIDAFWIRAVQVGGATFVLGAGVAFLALRRFLDRSAPAATGSLPR